MPNPFLLDRLLRVADLLQRDMTHAFAGTGLSPARMGVLWVIHHDGPSTQQTIAGRLDVSPRNVTGLVDALEQSGHAMRTLHPTDRRARLVALTPAGTDLMIATADEHAALNATLLTAVAPSDRASLARGLDAVIDHLADLVARPEKESAR